ncbi:MAG: M56 family metallopeptidase [Bacteroidales bacterium]|nr:M56 family metallopeptidase [Lachnoclostridium sp.]MCM1385594.1 M56 family metallopeptidase [Lachnoclostridium sp.]MCM1466455.1 M56 family metallopeptidase [Bacteroidales bacterium]
MNTILTLSLTGSCMMVAYYVLSFVMREAFSHRMRYLWLKLALIGYLLPLHWLGREYVLFLQNNFEIRLTALPAYYDAKYIKMVMTTEEGRFWISGGLYKEIGVAVLWFGIAIVILAVMLIKMRRSYKRLTQDGEAADSGRMCGMLSPAERKSRLFKRIKLHLVEGDYCGSGGLFVPFIIMKKGMEEKEETFIFRHELTHIKRGDILFKELQLLAVCVHWFNPFIYLLKRQMERECELSCDDRVLTNASAEERAEYAEFLVRHALKNGSPLVAAWKSSEIPLKERINNIMDRKEKNKGKSIVCMVLMAVMLFGSSFTVLAYDKVYAYTQTDDSGFNTEFVVNTRKFGFWEEGNDAWEDGAYIYPVLYDNQFTDEEGNVYEIEEGVQTYATCVHQYVSGKTINHTPYADGSCKYILYLAQRCTKCGYVKQGDVFSEQFYPVCPH